MPIVDHFTKYLGQPTIKGRAKNHLFSSIQDKVWKKLKGWKEKHLSFAGRGILIKAVAQAIPTYIMSSYIIPKKVCNQIESMTSRFWWGVNVDKRKVHWINWKKTCKKKEEGGMGFRNISAFNTALLAKQGWRIMTNPESLLAKVLKAKYFPKSHFLQAKKGPKASYSWQSILTASWILKRGCFWLIGNGKDINIWEDRWLHPKSHNATWTPKPTNTNLGKVQDLISPSSKNWDRNIISQTFMPIEAENILQIPLLNTTEDDLIRWQGTNDGIYTVKSGYNAQIEWENINSSTGQSSSNSKGTQAWKNLWNSKVPPKQTHLMWRIIHKAIPTKPNLINKGIICDSLCPRCEATTETIEHTFLHCEWVKQLWFASPLTINTDLIQNLTFEDWIFYMLSINNKESIQQILAITYSIWWSRNKKVFQKVDIPVIDALSYAMKSLLDFHLHTVDSDPNPSSQTAFRARNNTSWSPPPKDFLKLNVDMHLHDDVRWGCGMILRREDGRAVGAATKVLKGSDDSTLAEAIGLREALNWITTLNLQKVIIETDAKTLTTALETKIFPRTNWGNVIRKVSRDLDGLSFVSVSWVNRK
ncbi:hypothetical protein P8452_20098 [Trifolium repens]|nr:hypothetical protein P8452_20098 [Trifolium repens]